MKKNTPYKQTIKEREKWALDDWIIDTEKMIEDINTSIEKYTREENRSAINQLQELLKSRQKLLKELNENR
jgi:hypothetical protein